MKFAIADTFQRSLARLTGDEQTRAKAAVFDFQLNPASPGFSYERLQRAKDPNFRSARVSSDLRFIVHQMGENICACYVGQKNGTSLAHNSLPLTLSAGFVPASDPSCGIATAAAITSCCCGCGGKQMR